MKRENIIWVCVFAAFVFFCFYMRSEMQRNRAQLAADIHEEIRKSPGNILDAVGESVKKAAVSLDPTAQKATNGSGPPAGGVIEDITGIIKRTVAPDSSSTTNTTNTTLEGLGERVLDAATQTARKVDRIGLDATRMTDEQESQFGAQMANDITNQMLLVAESPEYARIARLMSPILDDRRRQQIHYTFHIVDSKTVNAFSLAGGYIYVTTEFLHKFPADASVVMALSHEVSHVELRHCAEKVQYARIGSKAIGDAAVVGGALYNALSVPYTKDHEFAADEYAFLACRKAGWNAADLIAMFTQLDAYEHSEDVKSKSRDAESGLESRVKNYFSSHPPTMERKQRLEKLEVK